MKRIALFLFGAIVVSASALAQTTDPAIETALLAAPASLRDGATVIKWKSDFEDLVLGDVRPSSKLWAREHPSVSKDRSFSLIHFFKNLLHGTGRVFVQNSDDFL